MKKSISSLLLCCLLVLSLPITCSASQLDQQKLERLDQIFNQLEMNNNEQLMQLQKVNDLLNNSDKQILELNKQVTISNNQITLLENQLIKANESISKAQDSLKKANSSLESYEKKTNEEIRSLRLQRDLSYVAIAYMFIKK